MWRVFKVVGFSEQVSSLSINIMYRKLDCVIKAACLAQKLEEQHQGEVKVFVTMRSRESWPQALEERKKEIPGSEEHRTSPIVYEVREMVLSIYLNLSFCCRVVLQKMTRHQPASSLLGALQSFFKKLQEDLGQLTCQIVRTFDLRESKFCLGQY
jgi:hypothetical protein